MAVRWNEEISWIKFEKSLKLTDLKNKQLNKIIDQIINGKWPVIERKLSDHDYREIVYRQKRVTLKALWSKTLNINRTLKYPELPREAENHCKSNNFFSLRRYQNAK